MVAAEYEFILVGGGLQSGLIALALRAHNPAVRIAIVERETRLGGNHTWCFHADDVAPAVLDWVAPLVCHRWPSYSVCFPGFQRTIDGAYSAITSDRMDRVVRDVVEKHEGSRLFLGVDATRIESNRVRLSSGDILTGAVVIDARGPEQADGLEFTAGFQKFVGLEVDLSTPHELKIPVLMDATVDQTDGFRFMYVLPLAPDRLLIEDTYFHHSQKLNVNAIRGEIMRYAEERGYAISAVIREETGVLPMPWTGSLPSGSARPIVAGYRGGWFHPATGYSFPIAARVAAYIAASSIEELARRGLDELVGPHASQSRYCHLLNNFLFRWYPPQARWHIFERFYRFPVETIRRFYALRMTYLDRIRLLAGKPPAGLSVRFRTRRGKQS